MKTVIVTCDGCGIELDESRPQDVTIGVNDYNVASPTASLCATCRLTLLERVADLFSPSAFAELRQLLEVSP